jgi:hypothetical protein
MLSGQNASLRQEIFANLDVLHLQERHGGYGDDFCLGDDDVGLENEYLRNASPARSE